MIALPNYEIKRVIGSGSFGKFKKSLDKITQIFLLGYVFEAYDNTNQRTVALKRI
jgi:serine/threonine protein kinase